MSDYQLLLERVARLYERHESGRREPFNVFSALRSESDEVNLHSRFLHALLDYRKSPEAERENLKDFLQHVDVQKFEQKGIKVERERDNIDILITNAAGQAVVIENKIWSEDQPHQLLNYHNVLHKQGYSDDNIHLIYLTPFGHAPSVDSAGDLEDELTNLSYKDDLPSWLERCQKRAYDEPALRESVAQYLRLVRKLTGMDFGEAYMSELKDLCLKDNNLVLVHDLREAMTEARIELLQKLWNEIDFALRAEISDLPTKNEEHSDVSYKRIKHFVTAQRNYKSHGLYYSFGNSGAALLGVEVDQCIYFGVCCFKKEYEEEYNKLREALKDVIGGELDDDYWPWHKYANGDLNLKNPTRENLELLSNDDGRKNYAQGIAQGVKRVWNTIKENGL